MSTAGARAAALVEELRSFALKLPEAYEDFPWGERAFKVRKKIFFFLMSNAEGRVRFGMKLPESNLDALAMPHAEPTHYGMGKYGWVTFDCPPGEEPPLGFIQDWIEESYSAIAPKKLAAQGRAAPDAAVPKAVRKPGARKTRGAKKSRRS